MNILLESLRKLNEDNPNQDTKVINLTIDDVIRLAKEDKTFFMLETVDELYAIDSKDELEKFVSDLYNYELAPFKFQHLVFENNDYDTPSEEQLFITENEEDVKRILREAYDYKFIGDILLEKLGNKNNRYLLVAEEYDRSPSTPTYKRKFNAPNDYIALMSMYCHSQPSEEDFIEYGGTNFNEYPQTYEEMLDYASETWGGDGDDYIILLENLTEDKTLYTGNGFDESLKEDIEDDEQEDGEKGDDEVLFPALDEIKAEKNISLECENNGNFGEILTIGSEDPNITGQESVYNYEDDDEDGDEDNSKGYSSLNILDPEEKYKTKEELKEYILSMLF